MNYRWTALMVLTIAGCEAGGRTSWAMSHEKTKKKNVAILVFEGVQIIDYSAPYEVFGQARFNVFTVAATKAPLTTAMGLQIIPTHDFASAPPAEVIVLPGGDVNTGDGRVIEWVRSRTAGAEVVLSVCNGAFWLAEAGLLDGLSATTFYKMIGALKEAAPKTQVVRDRRFVDNGKIVTAAGLSAGMDGSLHVVEKLLGRDRAQEIALHLEYDWNPDSTYARANLADRLLPPFERCEVELEVISSVGGADAWRLVGTLKSKRTAPALLAHLSEIFVAKAKWKEEAGPEGRSWTFADEQGRPWSARLELSGRADATGVYDTRLTLRRAD